MSVIEHSLSVRFPAKRYLLSSARAEGPQLTLFFPTQETVRQGCFIKVQVSFEDTDRTFELCGTVVFLRGNGWGLGSESGVGLSFTGDDKKEAAQLIAFCAGKPLDLGTSVRRRVVTSIRCRVRVGSQSFKAKVRDLSTGGAFIAARLGREVKVGSDIVLQLEPGLFGLGGRKLEIRVLWRGEKLGEVGFGGRFLGDQMRIAPVLKGYLNKNERPS